MIIFDDFTTASKWVDFPFKAKSSAMKMLRVKPTEKADLRFIFHMMQYLRFQPSEHVRHWISKYSMFEIKVPPLGVQREIAQTLDKLLDSLTTLGGLIETEREARAAQFYAFRSRALGDDGNAWSLHPLRDFVRFRNARAHEKLVSDDGDVPLITARFVSNPVAAVRRVRRSDVLTFGLAGETAVVMSDLPNGRALARSFYIDVSEQYAVNQRIGLVSPRDPAAVHPEFLAIALDRNPDLIAYDNGTDQTHLKKDWILDARVRLPPLLDQTRIVKQMKLFQLYAEQLQSALSSEKQARLDQYEYYRDRLLTFGELPA